MSHVAPYVTWWMALLPLVVLAGAWRMGRALTHGWWAVGYAYGVSWLADSAALVMAPAHRWLPSLLYPVVQCVILTWAFSNVPRTRHRVLAVCLACVGVAWLQLGPWMPDTLVRTVAWLTGGSIAWSATEHASKRASLVLMFGFGWVAWVWHTVVLSVPTWYVYQGVQALAILVFCWGAVRVPMRVRG